MLLMFQIGSFGQSQHCTSHCDELLAVPRALNSSCTRFARDHLILWPWLVTAVVRAFFNDSREIRSK
jgi:hypothetical protein